MKNKRILALLAALVVSSVGTVALAQRAERGDHAAPPQAPAVGDHGRPTPGEHAAEHAAEHADEGTEHAEHGFHEHGPAPINWTDLGDKSRPAYIGLAINFAILLTLYYLMGKKGVTDGLKQRRIDIGKDIDDARTMLEQAKERAKKYQSDLKNADVDASTAKASLISSGKGEVEHLLTEAGEKAERMKRDAERLVEQERKQLRQDMLVETIERAVNDARLVLEKQATSEDHARLAQELLAELARKPAAKRVGSSSIAPPKSAAPTSGGAT